MPKKSIITVWAVLVLLIAATVLPTFLLARNTPSGDSCINHLRLIDGATQQWVLENRKTPDPVPTWADVLPYLGGGMPTCPKGGKYTLGRLDRPPTCSYPGHTI